MPSAFPIPLNAVRAIEIVARRGALAPAAEELGVTAGAVSQHIRRAEARLGLELFERTPQGLRPTPALRGILPQLNAGFGALEEALAGLRHGAEHVLTVSVANVFASRWLIWRVPKFAALHPDIELRLAVSSTLVDLGRADIDCGIRFGDGVWPGARVTGIGGASYRPVCAPGLARDLHAPADLAGVPVIRDSSAMLSWEAWFAVAGAPPPVLNGPTYDDPTLAFDAAISGQGVLLAVDMMAADAVSDGRLVPPFETAAEGQRRYWLVVAEGRREPRKTRLFRDWLLAESADSAGGYMEQMARGAWRMPGPGRTFGFTRGPGPAGKSS